MKTTDRLFKFLAVFAVTVCTVFFAVSCSEDDGDELTPDVAVGEYVKDFKRVKQYGETQQFQNDLDAFVTYAISIQAFRYTWWMLLSDNFANNTAFSATPDDINGKKGTIIAEFAYTIIDEVVENAEQYEEAMERLQYSGVLPDPKASQTRGWIADGLNFIYNCRNAQQMGRKSVMAILQNSSMGTDTKKLKELYNTLPANLRSGYSDYSDFWYDFSKGKLDAKANQIFVNLYTYDPLDFGEKAKSLGITPGGNVTAAGAKLIESGMNLVIDASPVSTQLGYGKDLYGVYDATENLVKKGDVKGFLKNALSNAVNYGPILYNGMKFGDWEAYDLFKADEWKVALSQELLTSIINDASFEQTFQEAIGITNGERLIPNLVTAKDENGKEVLLVCMVDEKTGQMTVGFSMDKEGKITMNPKTPGTKQITVVGRNGKRKTKTIVVPKDKDTTVEVDLADDSETLLEDEPKDGYLKLDRSNMEFFSNGGRLKTLVIGNYLYYTCTSSDPWITCSIPSDMNEMTVRVTANDDVNERKGKVTVSATNAQGKVLKSVVLPIIQKGKEVSDNYITATPSTLEFNNEGGSASTIIKHSWDYAFTAYDYDNSMAGWASVDASEAEQGQFKLTVKATPNKTGKERSGIITVFAAYTREYRDDALNGKVDENNVLVTTVMVKQAAEEGETGTTQTYDNVLKTLDFQIVLKALDSKNISKAVTDDIIFGERTSDKMKVSRSGNTLHIECSSNYKDKYSDAQSYDYSYSLSFDISNFSDGFSYSSKAMNGKFESKSSYYEFGKLLSERTTRVEFSNVPSYVASQHYTMWQGNASGGVTFSNFYYQKREGLDGNEPREYTYTLDNNPENFITVQATFVEGFPK